jgi:predicted DNA-binding ribbon-helix-helix protein
MALPRLDRGIVRATYRSTLLKREIPGRHRLTGLIKRSFSLAGHRTSIALEDEFWTALNRMAQTRGQTLSALVATIDATRDPDRPLASALRVFALTGNE